MLQLALSWEHLACTACHKPADLSQWRSFTSSRCSTSAPLCSGKAAMLGPTVKYACRQPLVYACIGGCGVRCRSIAPPVICLSRSGQVRHARALSSHRPQLGPWLCLSQSHHMLCLSSFTNGSVLGSTTKQPSSRHLHSPHPMHLCARADGKVVRQCEDVDAVQEVPLTAGTLLESC